MAAVLERVDVCVAPADSEPLTPRQNSPLPEQHQNNPLLGLPIVAIEAILNFLSYDEISLLRAVRTLAAPAAWTFGSNNELQNRLKNLRSELELLRPVKRHTMCSPVSTCVCVRARAPTHFFVSVLSCPWLSLFLSCSCFHCADCIMFVSDVVKQLTVYNWTKWQRPLAFPTGSACLTLFP